MAKIRNVTISTESNHFDAQIEYISEFGFFIRIPEMLFNAYDSLQEADIKKYGAIKYYRVRDRSNYVRTICAVVEFDLMVSARPFFNLLVSQVVSKKPVIVVHYHNESNKSHQDPHLLEMVKPKVGVALELTYCFEVSVPGGKPKYEIYREDDDPFEKDKKRIVTRSINTSYSLIIDDTEKNRQFLNGMYDALSTLHGKMDMFFSDKEQLLKLISTNNSLLLSSGNEIEK